MKTIFWILLSLMLLGCTLNGKILQNELAQHSNDDLSTTPLVSVQDKLASEYGVVTLKVLLNQISSKPVTVNYYFQDSTAANSVNYNGIAGSVTIPAGETEAVVNVTIHDDEVKTANKKFFFNLQSATNAKLGQSVSQIEIQDDDFAPMGNVIKVSMGTGHTCFLFNTGNVKCVGTNSSGQIGDGTTTFRSAPRDVVGLASVVDLDSGRDSNCAVTSAGALFCWGDNSSAQLGDGTTTDRKSPVQIFASGVHKISVGENHACALMGTGAVQCWGKNDHGEIGDGTTIDRNTPTNVSGLSSGVIEISVGLERSCAVLSTGALKCWGYNYYGPVGDGTTVDKLIPTNVIGLSSGVVKVSTGKTTTCALLDTGALKCWGYGAVGDGSWSSRTSPVDVVGLTSGVTSIDVAEHACASLSSGGVWCWGLNSNNELGDGTKTSRSSPVSVLNLSETVIQAIVSLDTSTQSKGSCALLSSGYVKCWGNNINGQLASNTTVQTTMLNSFSDDPRTIPRTVTSLSAVQEISSGGGYTCASLASGGIKCWGLGTYGAMGDGTANAYSPIAATLNVSGISEVVGKISASSASHTCVVTSMGEVKCWGSNSAGQLGDGTTTDRSTPVGAIGLSSGVVDVATAGYFSCALTTAGAVKCWGKNNSSQLGDGTTINQSTPVTVSGLSSGVQSITAGGNNFYGSACALMDDGSVKCWGSNSAGQLGDGTTTNRSTPVTVSGLSNVSQIKMGDNNHVCALLMDKTVKCWGFNSNGQLGDNTTTSRSLPTSVLGLSSVMQISVGEAHTCALLESRAVKCWGNNDYAQLGDSTMTDRKVPVSVTGLNAEVVGISAGMFHTCAWLNDGTSKCWGDNGNEELGVSFNSRSPQYVVSP